MPAELSSHRGPATLAVAACVLIAAGLFGCGSTAKPSYCSDRSDLQQSVKGLTDVDLQSGGVSALQAQLAKVESSAKALVSSAKSDFPSETAALKSSVSTLSSAVKQLPSSPSGRQVAGLLPNVKSVTTAAQGLTKATSSTC